jgi:hypothetical protein
MNTFEVGQKVVHVPSMSGKYNFREIYSELQWPTPNEVYTIREIRPAPDASGRGRIGVALKEISDQAHPETLATVLWDAREFQPLSFLDIDISIFLKMLTPEGELVA